MPSARTARPTVAIFSGLPNWDPTYSISTVIKSQIRSFVRANYGVKMIVPVGCPAWQFEEHVEYLPRLPKNRFNTVTDSLEGARATALQLADELSPELENCSYLIGHDVLLLAMFLPYNLLMRELAERRSTNGFPPWQCPIHCATFGV